MMDLVVQEGKISAVLKKLGTRAKNNAQVIGSNVVDKAKEIPGAIGSRVKSAAGAIGSEAKQFYNEKKQETARTRKRLENYKPKEVDSSKGIIQSAKDAYKDARKIRNEEKKHTTKAIESSGSPTPIRNGIKAGMAAYRLFRPKK